MNVNPIYRLIEIFEYEMFIRHNRFRLFHTSVKEALIIRRRGEKSKGLFV